MKKNVIVSLADANYFPLLEELINSIKRFKESENIAICILDAGLTQEQKKVRKSSSLLFETISADPAVSALTCSIRLFNFINFEHCDRA